MSADPVRRYGPLAVLLAALPWLTGRVMVASSGPEGLRAGFGLGADFIAFRAAGELLVEEGPLAPYALDPFVARTAALAGVETPGLLYQYPPVAYALFGPLAWAPYPLALMGFLALTGAAMALALRGAGWGPASVALAMISPPVLAVVEQGQVTLLTTACLVVATTQARARPSLAGLAAAALCIKPQLGVLLPVFFLAVGARRAFAVAAVGSVAAVAASAAAFGAEAWAAFFEAAERLSDDMRHGTLGYTPVSGMVSPFALAFAAGLPGWAADALHWTVAGAGAGVALLVACSDAPQAHKAAAAVAATALISPYGYHYETALLLFPVGVLLREALAGGWLAGEREALGGAFGVFVLSGALPQDGVQWFAAATLLLVFVCLRRFALPLANGLARSARVGAVPVRRRALRVAQRAWRADRAPRLEER